MALPTDRGYPTGMMNYNPNGTGSSLSGSSLNYGVPGVDGGGMGDFLSQMWKKKLDDSEYAKRRADDAAILERWQAQQALLARQPTSAQKQMEAMALAERAAELEAKVNPLPMTYTAPGGVAPFLTENPLAYNSFQRAIGNPAESRLATGAIPDVKSTGTFGQTAGITGNAEANAGPSVAEKAAADRKRREQLAFSLMTPADQMLALQPYKGLQGGNG